MSEAVDTARSGNNRRGRCRRIYSQDARRARPNDFPSSDDVRNTTIIVIINVIFFAIYLFLVDQAWTYILEGLTWLVNKIAGYIRIFEDEAVVFHPHIFGTRE